MEGAASAIAVVSLAVQLGQSLRDLCSFWSSIRGAPEDIRQILDDLRILASIIDEVEQSGSTLDAITQSALQGCSKKVDSLVGLTCQLEPGFRSSACRVRLWNSFKAVFKQEKLKKFRESLDDAKITLSLALQWSSHGLVKSLINAQQQSSALFHQVHQESLDSITESLEQFRMESISRTVRTSSGRLANVRGEHIADFQAAARMIASAIPNQTLQARITEAIFNALLDSAVVDTRAIDFAVDMIGEAQQSRNPGEIRSRSGKKRHKLQDRGPQSFSVSLMKSSIFGRISTRSRTWLAYSDDHQNTATSPEQPTYCTETTITLFPAEWLMKLGIRTGLDVLFLKSTEGWKSSLTVKPFRAVSTTSMIFEFCRRGNIDGIKSLLAKGDATIWDRSPRGWTPLHCAAGYCRAETCKFLLDNGADPNALTKFNNLPSQLVPVFPVDPLDTKGLDNKEYTVHLLVDGRDLYDNEQYWNSPAERGWKFLFQLLDADAKVSPNYNLYITNPVGTHARDFAVSKWVIRYYYDEIKATLNLQILRHLCRVVPFPHFLEWFWEFMDIADSLLYEECSTSLLTGVLSSVYPRSHQILSYFMDRYINLHYREEEDTITSKILTFPKRFVQWATALHHHEIGFVRFVKHEINAGVLSARGWSQATLLYLMSAYQYTKPYPLDMEHERCENCGDALYLQTKEWDIALAKIKRGQRIISLGASEDLCLICRLCSFSTKWTTFDGNTPLVSEGGVILEERSAGSHFEEHSLSTLLDRPREDVDCAETRSTDLAREISVPGSFETVYV